MYGSLCNRAGYLKWHDVSTGKLVAEYPTKKGVCQALRQNPYNAVMHVGHANGTWRGWGDTRCGKSLMMHVCDVCMQV